MKKISVIIPVWNTEKYVGECIDSILAQSIVKSFPVSATPATESSARNNCTCNTRTIML